MWHAVALGGTVRRRSDRLAQLAGLGATLLALSVPLLGLRVTCAAPRRWVPETAVALEDAWSECLAGIVSSDRVAYGELARRGCVEEVSEGFARIGPRRTPDLFVDRATRLAYHVNAYNALVMLGVLHGNARHSVHEVRGWWAPDPGLGFFWAQRFWLDGQLVSLHGLEHDILRPTYRDARVHAAINCASASCPALRASAYRAASIDADLEEAGRRFASEAPHVVIDLSRDQIVLSSIYLWYASDFSGAGGEGGVLDWIERHAEPDVANVLASARGRGAEVVYAPYDWSLNGSW